MSLFGIAAVPLAKTVTSLVMATSVGIAGISDAAVLKTVDSVKIKDATSVDVFEKQTPKPLKEITSVFPIKDAIGIDKHDHDNHVNMVIPGCPHCMANLLAPHPDWMPNLVRSGESEGNRIRPVTNWKGEIIDLQIKDLPLRLPPVISEQPLRLPRQKPVGSISKVPSISRVNKVDSVSVKEKLGRVEHLNRSFVRIRS